MTSDQISLTQIMNLGNELHEEVVFPSPYSKTLTVKNFDGKI